MSNATILVTGINGFVGHYLAKELYKEDIAVIGIGNQPKAASELERYLDQYISCDLTQREAVRQAVDFANVTAVIHLAGLPSQAASFQKPLETVAMNGGMVVNLCEEALQQQCTPRFLLVSSGAIYDSDQPMPLTEESKLASNSPYAISKLLCEDFCDYYTRRGLECVIARPFNHTGPGQGPGFLIPDLTKNVAEAGEKGIVKVGNLQTRRDYSDVRDVVRAYRHLATAEVLPHRLYNVCSGQSHSGEEVLRMITRALFAQNAAVRTEVDSQRVRPYEAGNIYGDNRRLRDDFAWEPEFSLEQTITDYVEWFRKTNSQ